MKNLRHVYVCTLQVSPPGGSGNLGVHQQQTGMCEPVSNLTRRVSNKTFWIATLQQNYWSHFHKVMARETLSLFKTFEGLPIYRGPILSHFGFSSSLLQIVVPIWFSPRRILVRRSLSSVIFVSRNSVSKQNSPFPLSLLIWPAYASHKIFC
jgi:hypothetical protein